MTTAYVDPQSIHNPTAGSAIPATWGDTVRDDLEFLIAPPMVMLTQSSTTVVTGGAMLPWTTESWDTDAFHSTSTNTSRITIPTGLGGRYHVMASAIWDTNTAGAYRQISIVKNGATTVADVVQAPFIYVRQAVSVDVALAAGDYIEAFAGQDSGGTRSVGGNGMIFGARWVSRS